MWCLWYRNPPSVESDFWGVYFSPLDIASGALSAFAIDRASGKLAALNQEFSVGRGPVDLVVNKTGRNGLVSNYGGGSVAVLPIGKDGALKASAFIQHTGSSPQPAAATGTAGAFDQSRGHDRLVVFAIDEKSGRLSYVERIDPGQRGPRK
jgi:6-phosphogluconolactonase